MKILWFIYLCTMIAVNNPHIDLLLNKARKSDTSFYGKIIIFISFYITTPIMYYFHVKPDLLYLTSYFITILIIIVERYSYWVLRR